MQHQIQRDEIEFAYLEKLSTPFDNLKSVHCHGLSNRLKSEYLIKLFLNFFSRIFLR